MSSGKIIKFYLFLTMLIMSVIPLTTTYYFGKDVIDGALSMALNKDVGSLLMKSQKELKILSKLDPENAENYKKRFFEIQEYQTLFKESGYLKEKISSIYFTYFAVGVIGISFLALAMAMLLGQKISKRYQKLFQEYKDQNDKIRELENFDQWKGVARKLAHEIKNPLTPIEMMVSGLIPLYSRKTPSEFAEILKETKQVVLEELLKLKNMVHHFSHFARLPDPTKEKTSINDFVTSFLAYFKDSWPGVDFESSLLECDEFVALDRGLFRQVFTNILNNAREANKEMPLLISFSLVRVQNRIEITIFNNGKPIANRENIFKIYFSTKSSKENMGLGLNIVRKIVLDHLGDIECLPLDVGAAFKITLPIDKDTGVSNDN